MARTGLLFWIVYMKEHASVYNSKPNTINLILMRKNTFTVSALRNMFSFSLGNICKDILNWRVHNKYNIMKIKVFLSQIYLLAPQLTVDELSACWYAKAWPLLIEFLLIYILQPMLMNALCILLCHSLCTLEPLQP